MDKLNKAEHRKVIESLHLCSLEQRNEFEGVIKHLSHMEKGIQMHLAVEEFMEALDVLEKAARKLKPLGINPNTFINHIARRTEWLKDIEQPSF